jgi:hypothetical protein
MELNRPKFLSPSAVSTWLNNPEEYFLKYLAIEKVPRIPQTQAMSVGSSFDAYIKCYLYRRLFGDEQTKTDGFWFEDLFEKQVEPHNRDFAAKAGAVSFMAYKDSGALSKLFELLKTAKEPPMFEFTKCGTVHEEGGVYSAIQADGVSVGSAGPVIILGKPDLFFITRSDINVVLDWKVNGYCSTGKGRNPTPGYLLLLDGFQPQSKDHGRIHRDAIPWEDDSGLHYSLHPNIEMQEVDWARQITSYSWLCGAVVGSPIVVAVDQLCCRPSFPSPNITIAQHRCTVTEKFQIETFKTFQTIWDIVHSDHIFRDKPLVESIERCENLLSQATLYKGDDAKTDFLRRMRTQR